MHSTIVIFLDGVGIGENDPDKNPFIKKKFKFLEDTFGTTPHLQNSYLHKGNAFLFPVDACMGVEGLPQSGTGQTAIFTGINASKEIGKHFGPFPYTTLVPIIKEKSIFKWFTDNDYKVSFVNPYPKIFFDYLKRGGRRLSVPSLSSLLTEIPLKKTVDLRNGNAVSAEINNYRWQNKLKYKLPIIKPQTAARRIFRMAEKNQLVFFEYFFSDHLGHWRNKDEFDYCLSILDEFLLYLIANCGEERTILICSDHGNLEDMSVKTHTRNPAIGMTVGKNAKKISESIKSLYHIKKSIIEYY